MNTSERVIVIGSGFGGIASALRARAKGLQVTLVERLDTLGGRAQAFEKDGFKHDAGPTVITAPFLFDELFDLFGKSSTDYYTQVELETWYDFVFEDKKKFSYRGDIDHTYAEIAKFEPNDVAGYKKLLAMSEAIFKIGFEQLSAKPFTSPLEMIKLLPQLIKLKSYQTVYRFVASYIKNPYLQKVFSIHPLLVGGNPYSTTSIYSLIHYLERKWGIHFIMGGTGKLVEGLARLMDEVGIEIITGFDVEQIILDDDNNRVVGIKSSEGTTLETDMVIFNGDPAYAYENLFGGRLDRPLGMKPKAITQYSMGLFVLYFGTEKQFPEVAHHTIWLGSRHKELLKDIFERKVATDDFSLYLHRPTATDSSFAPEGCDSFYVLCPVPNLQSGTGWEKEGPRLRDRIVKSLDSTLLPGLEQCIVSDFFMTPADFQTDYKSLWGAGFSIAPLFSQSAYFRFRNQDPKVDNLFFVGAGTHPGAGLPGVVSSAKVTDALIDKYLKKNYSDELVEST
ncbi:phytoene desaturase family protein [Gammaproteobacteria bacterium]|nr:phytoene desaturase family protein [Gammaproteobacteria bacterium]